MKNNRQKVTLTLTIIYLVSILILYFFGGIYKALQIIALILAVIFIILLIITLLYISKTNKKDNLEISKLMDNGKIDECIDFLNQRIEKYFFSILIASQRINLISAYLMKNRVDEARELVYDYSYFGLNKCVSYYKIIFELYDGNTNAAKKLYNKFLKLSNPLYDIQKDNAKRLIELVETREFDFDLYNNTAYPIVKKICQMYTSK